MPADLVRSSVDVIVTGGTFAANALKAKTQNIPIAMAIVSDPVAAGLVDNLARVAERDCAKSVVDSDTGRDPEHVRYET